MASFSEIQAILAGTKDWADLKNEQKANTKSIVRQLHADVKRASAALRRAKPDAALRAQEPNSLAAIRQLRPDGPRELPNRPRGRALSSRIKGAWLGRAAGCTLGAPVECYEVFMMEWLARGQKMPFPPEDYWSDHPQPEYLRYGVSPVKEYLRGGITSVPVDDDLTYTILGLLILEDYGVDFTTDDVGAAWLKYLPFACTAEDVALRNLKAGVPAKRAAEKNNPWEEWIGADIRSDPWGYVCPGQPERAAEYAYRDAYISHRRNGIYGSMYFSAVIAAALAVDDPVEALEIGLTEIPQECRLAKALRWALRTGHELKDWREARQMVDERFKGMHIVHTINNACLSVFGLMLGKRDFTRTIGYTVAMGLDSDCTTATVGSILGAILGVEGIPEHWYKPFRNKTRTYLIGHEWFKNSDIVKRFAAIAER